MKTIRDLSVLCVLSLIGLSACKQRATLQDEIISSEAERIAQAGPSEAKNVRFDNRYELVGAASRLTLDGLVLETAWKSLKKQRRTCLVPVHLTDKDGKILAQADYRQVEAEVPEGTFWLEKATIPLEKLEGATAIGIGLVESGEKWLLADRGPRDMENHRLLLPLPTDFAAFQKGIPYEGFLEAANCQEIVGWVWNKTLPNEAVKIEICDNNTVIQTVEASEFREDVAKNSIGTGKYGFRVPTPPQFMDGKPHTLRARVAGAAIELRKSPISVTCKGK